MEQSSSKKVVSVDFPLSQKKKEKKKNKNLGRCFAQTLIIKLASVNYIPVISCLAWFAFLSI